MHPKKNIAFTAIVAILVVVFLIVAVWLLHQASAVSKLKNKNEAKEASIDRLKTLRPTKQRLEGLSTHKDDDTTAYAQLKEQLLTWWDKDVYDPEKSPRNPGLFLGNLQTLSRQIRYFAYKKKVTLGTDVPNLSFPELLGEDRPPREVTYDMLKQASAVRDILMLLIHEEVESIDSIAFLSGSGPEPGGKLFKKYLFSVSFSCRYPSLANFQADLVNRTKTPVDPYGEYPRNFLVIQRLSYDAADRKVASLEAAAAAESAAAEGRTTPSTGPAVSPYGRELAIDEYGRAREFAPREREETKPTIGREPNYNILNVTMTITLFDFTEEITGPIPGTEERNARTAANSPRIGE